MMQYKKVYYCVSLYAQTQQCEFKYTNLSTPLPRWTLIPPPELLACITVTWDSKTFIWKDMPILLQQALKIVRMLLWDLYLFFL
jgi:hypothetical protein